MGSDRPQFFRFETASRICNCYNKLVVVGQLSSMTTLMMSVPLPGTAIWRPGIHGPVIEYPAAFAHIGSSSRRAPAPKAGKALAVSMRTGRSTRCRVRYPQISPDQSPNTLSNTLSKYSSFHAVRRQPQIDRFRWVSYSWKSLPASCSNHPFSSGGWCDPHVSGAPPLGNRRR